jgi:Zn-dependent protease with chaperone function
MIIALVALAAYTLLDLAVSAFVALVWRTRAVAPTDVPPAARARRLLLLRLVPSVAAGAITLAVVIPAFVIFEPATGEETVGPVLVVLAIAAIVQFAVAVTIAARSILLTARIERTWLQASIPLAIEAGGLRAFAIESTSPIVALVGVFAPKLIAARSVVESCDARELAGIVGHERGHFESRDNLKRWILSSLPDALRWTPIHREITDAWHHAAEDAADDASTGGEVVARAELAALLLKVVRLAPPPTWHAAIVSPFVGNDGLERRVRRLLQPDLEPPAPRALVPMIATGAIVAGMLIAISSPEILEGIFDAFEFLVAFGR